MRLRAFVAHQTTLLQRMLKEKQAQDNQMFDGEPLNAPLKINHDAFGRRLDLFEQPEKPTIDIELFQAIKADLKLMKQVTVARAYKISATTVSLINKSRSFKQYKELRESHSRPSK